jgi:hypothetical protein
MLTAHTILRATAVIALASAMPGGDVPRLACKEDITIRRTLEMKGTRELSSLVNRQGDLTQEVPNFHMTIEIGQKQVVDDEVQKCAGDRASKLARTYVTLEKSRTETRKSAADESKNDKPETSDLAGKTVLFVWDADAKSWTRTIDGKEDKKLTADLEGDMDYRGFLPAKDAEAGAKWDVDFADVKGALVRPGGDIPFHGETEPQAMDKRLREASWDANHGKLTLTLEKTRDEEGKKLVTISFTGDVGYDASVEREGDEKGPAKLRVADHQTLEGELVWDLAAGRAHDIHWTSKGEMTLTVDIQGKAPDGTEVSAQQVLVFDENYTYTGTIEQK